MSLLITELTATEACVNRNEYECMAVICSFQAQIVRKTHRHVALYIYYSSHGLLHEAQAEPGHCWAVKSPLSTDRWLRGGGWPLLFVPGPAGSPTERGRQRKQGLKYEHNVSSPRNNNDFVQHRNALTEYLWYMMCEFVSNYEPNLEYVHWLLGIRAWILKCIFFYGESKLSSCFYQQGSSLTLYDMGYVYTRLRGLCLACI